MRTRFCLSVAVLSLLSSGSLSLKCQWQSIESNKGWFFWDAQAIPPDRTVLLGDSGIALLDTRNWDLSIVYTFDKAYIGRIRSMSSFDGKFIYAVGDGSVQFHSSDSGQTWSSFRTPTSGVRRGISCISDSLCFLYPYGERILRTSDYGKTWTDISVGRNNASTSLEYLEVFPDGKGLGVGSYNYIVQTMDSGRLWNPVAPIFNKADERVPLVHMVKYVRVGDNKLLGIAMNEIWCSFDFGETWTLLWPSEGEEDYNSPTDIAMNGEYGVVTGAVGLILETCDSGQTWHRVTSPVQTYLSAVTWIDSTVAVVVGKDGTILRNSPVRNYPSESLVPK